MATRTGPGPLRSLFLRALVPFYRRLTARSLRWTERLTPAGWMVFGLAALTGIMGVDTNRTQLYEFFAVLLAICVVSVLSTLLFLPRVRVRRLLPKRAAVGQPLRYSVELENLRRRPLADLSLVEVPATQHPSTEAFVHEREPGERSRNLFDRVFVFYRWRWLQERGRFHHPRATDPVRVDGRARVRLRMELVPRRRGMLTLHALGLLQPDVFGLFRALRVMRRRMPRDEVVVLPRRYKVPRLELAGRSEYQPAGTTTARSHGQGEEFVSLRDYRPGDPQRHIHWRSWARLRRPLVKEYVEEFIPRYALVLDTFLAADPGERFEEAVSVAASFTCELESDESLLDLMFVGTEAYRMTTGRGRNETERLLEVLAMVELCRDREFEALEEHVLANVRDMSACVCILLDADPPRRRFVERLRAQRMPVTPLLVAHDDVPLPPGWHRLPPGEVESHLAALR